MFTVGSEHNNYYPVYDETGTEICQSLNREDAVNIAKAMTFTIKAKEILKELENEN